MSKITLFSYMFYGTGIDNPNFYINARYVTWNTSATVDSMFYPASYFASTTRFYAKDATAVSFIRNAGFPSSLVINCSTTSCP